MTRAGALLVAAVFALPVVASPVRAAPTAPVIVSPEQGSSHDAPPVFGWEPVTDAAAYRVQIATSGGFATPLVDRRTVNRWLTLAAALPAGTFDWRVAALDAAGTAGDWATGSFAMSAVLATPQLTPAIVDAAWPDGPRVLEWTPIPGAAGYDLRLTSGALDTLDDTNGFLAPGPRFAVNPYAVDGALVPTMYWQVRARAEGGGAVSGWSEVGELRSSWPGVPDPAIPDGATATTLTLAWARVPGASAYAVEVEPLDGQGQPVALRATAPLLSVADYTGSSSFGRFRWRVRGTANPTAYQPQFGSEWSGWRTITVERVAGPLPVFPLDGATTDGDPGFAWTPVPRRTEYVLEVSADPAFATGVYRMTTWDTAIASGTFAKSDGRSGPFPLRDATTYHWRVRAFDHNRDGGSEWSAPRSFTVAATPIALLGPADGAVVEVPSLTWDGARSPLFVVTVRNVRDEVVATGRTAAGRWTPPGRLNPAEGPFTWKVAARSSEDVDGVLASSATRSFTLVAPATTGAEPVLADTPATEPWLTFTWTPVTGAASYNIVATSIYGDQKWAFNYDDGPLAYTSYTPNWYTGAAERPMTWRVVAYAEDGSEIVRGPARTLAVVPAPDTPVVTGPASCSEAACGTPASPVFTWTAVPRAAYYAVLAGGDYIAVTGTSAQLLYPQAALDGTFTWSVRACGFYSTCSAPSAERTYTWTRVLASLDGPADGATVEDVVTVGVSGGVPPTAPPGEMPSWTFQDPRLQVDDATYEAGDEPWRLTWGYPDGLGPTRTLTLQASTPAHIVPAEGATTDGLPLLRWTPLSGQRAYVVDVHRGADGPMDQSTLVIAAVAFDAAWVPSTALAPGTYRWRVRRGMPNPFSGAPIAGSPWSAAHTFTVAAAAAPTLDGPADGATRTPADLLFTWSPVTGAAGYRVELARDAAFGVLGTTASSVGAAWAPGAALSGGTWHWRVIALGSGDTPIATSGGRTLILDAPILKPLRNALVVNNGSAFGSDVVDVTFPVAAATGPLAVRISNDGITWRTLPWQAGPYRFPLSTRAADTQPGAPAYPTGLYTIRGQWEDADGNWSAIATDTVLYDLEDPVATVTLDGGAATTADAEVLLDIDVADAGGGGAVQVCQEGDGCRFVATTGEPIPWTLPDPTGPAGKREVCVLPFDGAFNWGESTCAQIELTGAAPRTSAPGHVGLMLADTGSAPTHWRAGDTMTVTPLFGTGSVPSGDAVCTWELRWGDHLALRDAAVNGSGGGVTTSGTAAEGFCTGWAFTIPNVEAGQLAISFTARAADGAVLAATPADWAGHPRIRIVPDELASAELTTSSLPVVALDFAGSTTPGEPLTYTATPIGFAATGPTLVGRSPTGSVATSANGTGLAVAVPEEGRWSVRWSASRGNGFVAAYVDPLAAMLDAAAPVSTAPVARPRTGSALGSTAVATRLTWSGADAGSGIARWDLRIARNGGPWMSVHLPGPLATSLDVSLARTGSYRWQVRAIDAAGNPGAWTSGPLVRPALVADSSASVRGLWLRSRSTLYSGGSTRFATARGASASYTFTGSAIAWVAQRGPKRGVASVYLDGHIVGTVDLRAAATQTRRQVFSYAWPTSGAHTLRIVVAGTAGRPRVEVDAFVVFR